MTLDQVPAGSDVFVDSNILVCTERKNKYGCSNGGNDLAVVVSEWFIRYIPAG